METQSDARTRAAECQRLVCEYVRAHPLSSVGTAVAAGLLLGVLLARR
jgi:ElaB/YqjD/DUF883 family membrane-anchored ribosome-binding protein